MKDNIVSKTQVIKNDPTFVDGCARIKQIGEIYLTGKIATEEGRQELRERIEVAEFEQPLSLNEAMTHLIFIASLPYSEARTSKLDAAKAEVRTAAQREYKRNIPGKEDPRVSVEVYPFDCATLKVEGQKDYLVLAEDLPGILYALSTARMRQQPEITLGSQWVSNPDTPQFRKEVRVIAIELHPGEERWIRTQAEDGELCWNMESQSLEVCTPVVSMSER